MIISIRARRLVDELQDVWDLASRFEIVQRTLDEERAAAFADVDWRRSQLVPPPATLEEKAINCSDDEFPDPPAPHAAAPVVETPTCPRCSTRLHGYLRLDPVPAPVSGVISPGLVSLVPTGTRTLELQPAKGGAE